MNSHIKKFFIFSIGILIGNLSLAQEELNIEGERSDTITSNMKKFRPRLMTLSLNAEYPNPTGEKYFGLGMEGRSGYNFKAQMFIYKQTFVKVGFGVNTFRVTDERVTGNYQKTSVIGQYLAVGYEFLPIDRVRLGFSLSVVGAAEYRNRKTEGPREAKQTDTAKLKIYEMYIDYELRYFMAVTFNYAYRNDKMNIEVAEELQSNFDRAQFHNFGLGVKFYIGDNNLLN